MSTWSTPKTDWATDDAVGTTDLNRIEGNIADMRMNAAANGRMGVVTLTAGAATVLNTSVTANTRIFLTLQNGTTADGNVFVSAITPGVSFAIGTDGISTHTVAYLLLEPQ